MEEIIVAGGNGSPASDWEGALTDLEAKADADSLDDLHARRRQILPEYAALRALHGNGGKWGDKRKTMLSAIKVRVRNSEPPRGKWTDDSVDDAAHADEQYTRFVDEGIDGATRFFFLDVEMNEITERIKNRETVIYAWSAEARMTR